MDIQSPQIQIFQQEQEDDEIKFRDYWIMLKRRWLSIFLSFVIVIGLAASYLHNKSSIYRATAVIKVPVQSNTGRLAAALGAFLPIKSSGNVATEIEIIKLRSVAENVIRKLELHKKQRNLKRDWRQIVSRFRRRLKASQKGASELIDITAIGDSPEEARDIANAVAAEYIRLSETTSKKLWDDLKEQMEAKLEETRVALGKSRNLLHSHEAEAGISTAFSPILTGAGTLTKEYGTQYMISEGARAVAELEAIIMKKEVELAALKQSFSESDPNIIKLEREIEASRQRLRQEKEGVVEKYDKQFDLTRAAAEVVFNQQLYSSLVTKHEELKAQQIMQSKTSEIIEEAVEPFYRSSPKRVPILMLGAVLGLFLGLGVALLREYTDNSIHTVEDITTNIELPVLGSIPRIGRASNWLRRGKNATRDDVLINYEASSRNREARELYRESYRLFQLELMASISKEAEQRQDGLALLVTSSREGEGKSLVAANLAISMAQTGYKVLLVDANRRGSVYHDLLGPDADAGIIDILMENAAWDDAISHTPLDSLSVITCGGKDEQADLSSLLISPHLEDFLKLSKESFDITIFDSSPVIPTSESAAIGSKVDGVVLVIEVNSTQKDLILRAKERMRSSGSNILGAVLNCGVSRKYG